jgi:hypothetical protein
MVDENGNRCGVVCYGGDTLRINCGNGVYQHFEDHPYCGPMPVHKVTGEPLKGGPGPRHPFWKAVECWYKQGKRTTDDGRCIWHHEPKPITKHLGGNKYEVVGYEPTPADIS